jgi:peptidoglycan/LPS O-acetylase OafA/YrhL
MHCVYGILTPELHFLPPSYHAGFFSLMVGGVDLFFVLSGFLIGGILLDSRKASNFFRVFWTRRAGRILPVYLLVLCTYILALAFNGAVKVPWLGLWLLKEPLLPLWSYATFSQNYFMAAIADTGALWIGITWSLAIEEQFYLVFPLLVYALRLNVLVVLALGCLVLSPLLRLHLWSIGPFYAGYFPTPARLDGLMFGFLATCIVRNSALLAAIARYRSVLDVLAAAGLALILEGSAASIAPNVDFSLASAIFAYGILRIFISDGPYRAALRNRFLCHMGLISYALYMYHQAVNGLLHGLLLQHAPRIANLKEFAVACLVLVTAVALAELSRRFYERPFQIWAHRAKYDFGAEPRSQESAAQTAQ